MKCPICDKAGLAEDAKFCPQCDSDLSGFVVVKKIATEQSTLNDNQKKITEQLQKSQITKRNIIIVSLCGVLLITFFGFWLYSEKISAYNQVLNLAKSEKDSLQRVVTDKQVTINKLATEKKQLENQETSIKYIVRKGDNLIKISRLFYSNDNQYREIIKDNNLQESNYTLFVGDTLTIKLKR
jgi:hypothetical protein